MVRLISTLLAVLAAVGLFSGWYIWPADVESYVARQRLIAREIAGPGLLGATNQVVVTVVNTNNEVVFNNWLSFTLAAPINATNTAISDLVFRGQKLSQPPPTVTGFISGGTATNFPISTSGPSSVTIQLTYVPAETRKFAPVQGIPTPPASGVVITNVAGIPGGGIRFSFNVPSGTNYAVLASTNVAASLSLWQTNATGVGQPGLTSYTNTAGGNSAQFYRIKY